MTRHRFGIGVAVGVAGTALVASGVAAHINTEFWSLSGHTLQSGRQSVKHDRVLAVARDDENLRRRRDLRESDRGIHQAPAG